VATVGLYLCSIIPYNTKERALPSLSSLDGVIISFGVRDLINFTS